MQNIFAKLRNNIPEPSLRAEIEIHSLDYDFPQASRPPTVKSRAETTQAVPMPGMPVLSTASSSCSPATNAPSFHAQSPSSDASQRTAGAQKNAATKPSPKSVNTERSSMPRQALSPAGELARKKLVVQGYLDAIQASDVGAVKFCLKNEIRDGTLNNDELTTALWFAIKGKNMAMIELIIPVSNHSAKLEVMIFLLNLKAAQRAALKPGVDAIMQSYQTQQAGGRPCSSAQRAEAEQIRKYL